MEAFVRRYGIFLKKHVTDPFYLGQVLIFVLLAIMVMQIQIPTVENTAVGVYVEEELPLQFWERLENQSKELDFVHFFSEKELYTAVISAKIDSGFILPAEWENEGITYVQSSTTTKGALAMETVFAACYPVLSEEKLRQADERIYGQADRERQKYLLEKNAEYLSGSALFDIQIETIDNIKTEQRGQRKWPWCVFLGFFVVLFVLLQRSFLNERRNVGALRIALPRRELWQWWLAFDLATATVPMGLSVLVLLICFGE